MLNVKFKFLNFTCHFNCEGALFPLSCCEQNITFTYRVAALHIKLDNIFHVFRLRDAAKGGCADARTFGKLYVCACVSCVSVNASGLTLTLDQHRVLFRDQWC